jgi:hypothetical protein
MDGNRESKSSREPMQVLVRCLADFQRNVVDCSKRTAVRVEFYFRPSLFEPSKKKLEGETSPSCVILPLIMDAGGEEIKNLRWKPLREVETVRLYFSCSSELVK